MSLHLQHMFITEIKRESNLISKHLLLPLKLTLITNQTALILRSVFIYLHVKAPYLILLSVFIYLHVKAPYL